jgi:hypothetical protein
METNSLPTGYHAQVTANIERTVDWTEPGLRVTRLRLVSDPGFPLWDVSYCHGDLRGAPVLVNLPFSQLLKPRAHPRRASLAAQIVAHAVRDRVHARSLGILGCVSTLN